MPKFNATIEFGLTTEVEVDLPSFAIDGTDAEGVKEYEDSSYFSSQTVDIDGGSISLEIEADSEEDAEGVIQGFVRDGLEIEDSYGVTWLVDNVSVDLDEIEEPLTVESAKQIVLDFLETVDVPSTVLEAIRFLVAASKTPFDS